MKMLALAVAMAMAPLSSQAADLLSLYQQAKESDPQIRAARANRDANYEAKPLARSALLPNVSVSGDLSYTSQDVNSNLSGASNDDFSSNALGLRVVQPLFRKDRLVALEQAEDQVKQADADYASA